MSSLEDRLAKAEANAEAPPPLRMSDATHPYTFIFMIVWASVVTYLYFRAMYLFSYMCECSYRCSDLYNYACACMI